MPIVVRRWRHAWVIFYHGITDHVPKMPSAHISSEAASRIAPNYSWHNPTVHTFSAKVSFQDRIYSERGWQAECPERMEKRNGSASNVRKVKQKRTAAQERNGPSAWNLHVGYARMTMAERRSASPFLLSLRIQKWTTSGRGRLVRDKTSCASAVRIRN